MRLHALGAGPGVATASGALLSARGPQAPGAGRAQLPKPCRPDSTRQKCFPKKRNKLFPFSSDVHVDHSPRQLSSLSAPPSPSRQLNHSPASTSQRRNSKRNPELHCRADSSWGGGCSPRRKYCSVLIVPTGVGAAVGGCAGDALPVARAFAEASDVLITHPNVMNGAMLFWPLSNTLYVEGYGLDRFAAGDWGLAPVHQNRVGLVLDGGMEEELIQRHLQAADAARATLGIPMPAYTLTREPLQVEKWVDPSTGASTGRIKSEQSLLEAVQLLIEQHQVDAVAVVGRFPDDAEEELEAYRQGEGVDVLAGVEAVISHLVVSHFGIPCAHAPALEPLSLLPSVAPRSAAEETGYTFLPCVLAGLSKAPQFVARSPDLMAPYQRRALSLSDVSSALRPAPDVSSDPWRPAPGAVWADDVDCVALPGTAFGGAGARALGSRRKKPLFIAVEENSTVMQDPPESLGIPAVLAANYWEALGIMVAHKAGIEPLALRAHGIKHLAKGESLQETRESTKSEAGSRIASTVAT